LFKLIFCSLFRPCFISHISVAAAEIAAEAAAAASELFPANFLWFPAAMEFNMIAASSGCLAICRGAIHQLLSIILKLRILVLLPVLTIPYVV
jgi:hypothetical protein